eukprot:6208777-Pleurochrysis_carterae.AAC.8
MRLLLPCGGNGGPQDIRGGAALAYGACLVKRAWAKQGWLFNCAPESSLGTPSARPDAQTESNKALSSKRPQNHATRSERSEILLLLARGGVSTAGCANLINLLLMTVASFFRNHSKRHTGSIAIIQGHVHIEHVKVANYQMLCKLGQEQDARLCQDIMTRKWR